MESVVLAVRQDRHMPFVDIVRTAEFRSFRKFAAKVDLCITTADPKNQINNTFTLTYRRLLHIERI